MRHSLLRHALLFPASALVFFLGSTAAHADSYDDLWGESYYITQTSCTEANASCNGHVKNTDAAYGILNDWRIGNGQADYVQPAEAAVGAIGLLYGYNRLTQANRSTPDLDTKVKTALSGFFWSWIRNTNNMQGNGFPLNISYKTDYSVNSKDSSANPRATAELLIAMRKYTLLSPNGDRSNYQSQEYALAHQMADYINANLGSWTVDRSLAVAAFHGFAHWAYAVGDNATGNYYDNRANTISGWLAGAQDHGAWHNYFRYLDSFGNGTYGIWPVSTGVDQTGFSPYEYNARSPGEDYAKGLADWWSSGTAYNNVTLTQQSGPYAGGVHQWLPQDPTDGTVNRVYPGDSLQLADTCWKIAQATGNYHDNYGQAWWHYNFARSALGMTTGSGDWVNNWTADPGFIGGFVDWVNLSDNSRPVVWQRFVDTSAYFIIATEELVYSNQVDFSY